MPGIPWWGDSVTLTIVPLPGRPIARANAVSAMFSVPSTFNRHTARQPFAVIPSAGVKYWPPALFTSSPLAISLQRLARSAPPPALADVARDPVRGGADLRDRALQHLLAATGDHDRRAAAGQLQRGRLAQTGAPTGHERDPAVQQAGREDLRFRAGAFALCDGVARHW